MPPTPLALRLADRIRREGPITFHDLMQAALYDAKDGYYARGPRIGPEGDFSTSVSFPAFRAAMARLVERARDALGKPPGFRVVELGAGTGQLARAIREAHPDVPYLTVDPSPALRARQEQVPGVRAVASPRDVPAGPALVLGNEVLDAFPVHRVVGGPEGGLLEVVVDVVDDDGAFRFKERLAAARDPALAERFRRVGVWPQRGQVCDVAPGMDAFVRDAARLADPGFLVLIDYGDPARALYAPTRLNGTLAAYKAQGRFFDWYDEVGERDLTADVDFTAVELAGIEAGMECLGLIDQQSFLEALGIHELGLPDEARMVAGAAGLGTAFKVMAFRRGTTATLPGFA